MERLVVITTPELESGYRLAGVTTLPAASPAEAAAAVEGLLATGSERGVLAVHEPFFNAFEESLRKNLERNAAPLAVPVPAGTGEAAFEERRTRLRRMLWQAVGYEITFEAEGVGA
jgi:vacuolar-type H+-ATPase subunit F/Vma7